MSPPLKICLAQLEKILHNCNTPPSFCVRASKHSLLLISKKNTSRQRHLPFDCKSSGGYTKYENAISNYVTRQPKLFKSFFPLLKFQVHVRTYHCRGGAATCNCGIAAREGDDVVVIDTCRGGAPTLSFPSSRLIEPNNGTRITRDWSGRNFVVRIFALLSDPKMLHMHDHTNLAESKGSECKQSVSL